MLAAEFGAASNGGCCAAVRVQRGACLYEVPLPNTALTATTLRFPRGSARTLRCLAARSFTCVFINANDVRVIERFVAACQPFLGFRRRRYHWLFRTIDHLRLPSH